jgi:hypothetical protein
MPLFQNSTVDLIKNLVAGDPSKIDLTSTDSALKFYQAQGLTPLVYHRLRDQNLNGSVPIEILDQLRKVYYLTAASNLAKLNQTSKVLQAFQEATILAIPLKGIALIESLYPNPAIRPMADVDLLIKPEDMDRVKGILEGLGYRWISSYRGSHNFIDEEGRWSLSLDLHTKFIRFDFLFHIDDTEIYDRLIQINFNHQIQVPIFCPEHQLIHLALHLAPGLYSQLNPTNLFDIYYLINGKQSELSWEYLVDFAKRAEVASYIYAPISLCVKIFDIKLPQSVLTQLGKGLSFSKRHYLGDDYLKTILDGGILSSRIFLERLIWAEGFSKKNKLIQMAVNKYLRIFPQGKA